ncbi:MAG TPA: ribosome small subunit-dependent GTPase A [Bacteroidia bacterium]|nr:ribosome small subunit-dependent GTPase A [Bacteroidia bacterium]HNT80680.1 ribosome small subunit-dependent GTPase A [Bacteroidia bacterium]
MNGLVLKHTGKHYEVLASDKVYGCTLKGNFRTKDINTTNPIAVGDWVEIVIENDQQAVITKLHERKNHIIRKATKLSKPSQIIAANIDCAYLVVTRVVPETSTGFIDRFLATCEAYTIDAALIINKMDLYDDEEEKEIEHIYSNIGYPVYKTSVVSGLGMEELKKSLQGKINLFSGHSGVGKSTLLNKLIPGLKLKTGEISLTHFKGMHTTSFSEMHRMNENTFIIDTPGIREFGTFEFDPQFVAHYFKEMLPYIEQCRYNNCIHVHEKDCAVIQAVESGAIHPERYYNYISILKNEDIFN